MIGEYKSNTLRTAGCNSAICEAFPDNLGKKEWCQTISRAF